MATHRVAIFSDVHFTAHHQGAWQSFRKWHAEHKPDLSIFLGDMLDLTCLSRYKKEEDSEPHAIKEMQYCIKECNELRKETGKLVMLPGNHDRRWEKAVYGDNAVALKGAIGLTLKDQFYAQGLHPQIGWFQEGKDTPGLFIGKRAVMVMHGDKQSGPFGTKHVASGLLARFPSTNVVVGHHHRLQHMCRTELDRTTWCIANPHLSGSHDYNITPDWQRGFTVLEFYGRARLRDCTRVTPHTILMDSNGNFCYNGKVY